MPGELPQRLHDALLRPAGAGIGDGPGVVERQLLAVVLVEPRLVVVGIDVADAALHEQEDDALGLRGEVRQLRGERVGRAAGFTPAVGRGEPGERQGAEPAPGAGEPFAARKEHGSTSSRRLAATRSRRRGARADTDRMLAAQALDLLRLG